MFFSFRSIISFFSKLFFGFFWLFSCSPAIHKTEVDQEAQHRTKVWLLERYQQIEHPLITELFQRSLDRLQPGIATLDQSTSLPTMPRLYVLASDEVTAFSICDGSIFITSKMFKMTPSIEVFMAILAHEMSHLIRKDACWITEDSSTELSKEITADTDGAQILYASYINPRASLLALSLYYRKFKDAGSDNFTESLETRKKSLSDELSKYPQIATKIPEERLYRKVKVLLHKNNDSLGRKVR